MDGPRILVVDRPGLAGGPGASRRAVEQIRQAAEGHSTFYLRDHGVEEPVGRLQQHQRQFFALPRDDKMLVTARSPQGAGYHVRDPQHEVFVVLRGQAPVGTAQPFVDQNLWPARLPDLVDVATSYLDAMYELSMDVLRAVARGLDLCDGFFEAFFGAHAVECLQLHQYDAGHVGARPDFLSSHVDPSAITLIAQDEAGGLESLLAGCWVPVSPAPGTLVVQFGQCLARWTNDRYSPSVHRVVKASTEIRRSIVYSVVPRADATIACLPSCVDDGHPARYAPISVARYMEEWASARVADAGSTPREGDDGALRSPIVDELRGRVAAATGRRWTLRSVVRTGDVLRMEFDVCGRAFSLSMQPATSQIRCYKTVRSLAFWYSGEVGPPVDLATVDDVIQSIAADAAGYLRPGAPEEL